MDRTGHQRFIRDWLPPWLPLLSIAAPLALFWPVLTSDRTLAFRDSASFYYPLFQWIEEETLARELPLWNPHVNFGVPLVGEASSSLFYPGKIVLMLPVEFSWKFKWYVVGHVLFASLAAYYSARRFGASPEAAGLAAISYSCGGAVLFQYCNVVFLVGAAWLPLAFAATETMLIDRCWRSAVGLGIVLAMMVLGGDPQMAYHALLAGSGYAVALWWMQRRVADQPRQTPRYVLLGVAAVTAFGLSAVQVLPALEASAWSERASYHEPRNVYEAAQVVTSRPEGFALASQGLFGEPTSDTHAATIYDFSFAPWHLIEYVWPNISGSYFPQYRRWMDGWPAEPRMWSPSVYLGLLPFLLAIASLRLRRAEDTRQTWLSWCVLLAVLGSFGAFGAGALVQYLLHATGQPELAGRAPPSHVGGVYWFFVTFLPGYAQFRYPAKLLTFAALPICLLAALGFDRLQRRAKSKLGRPRTMWWKVAVPLAMVLVISLVAACLVLPGDAETGRRSYYLSSQKIAADANYGPFESNACATDMMTSLCRTIGFASVLAVCLAPQVLSFRWGGTVLLAITALEICSANAPLITTAPSEHWRAIPQLTEMLAQHDALPTVRPPVENDFTDPNGWHASSSPMRIEELAAADRHAMRLNHALAGPIDAVDALTTQPLADYVYFYKRFHQNEESFWGNYWLLSQNAQQITSDWQPIESPEFSRVTQLKLFRHRDPYPRAWIVRDVSVLPELRSRDPLDLVVRGREVVIATPGVRRDFRRQAVVETSTPLPSFDPQANNETEYCRVESGSPNRVVVQARLNSPGLLVLADTHFSGWSVEQGTIHRTDRILRGVQLDAGEHTVTFAYQPWWLYGGAVISAAGWLAVSCIAGRDLFASRR